MTFNYFDIDMHNVSIKIKKGKHSPDQIADNLKIDLNEKLEKNKKQPFRRWLFLIAFLLLGGLIFTGIQVFFFSNKIAFSHLIPEETVIFSLIDQESLYNQTASFYEFLQENNFYGQNAISKINGYFNQADLDLKDDINPLFKKQAAFVLMTSVDETSFPFAIILEKNQSSSKIEQILSKIEPNLKEDYNFSTEDYRQIKTTILKPIFSAASGMPDLYVYAQIEEYFIICNSKQIIKAFTDLIID